MHVGHFVRGKGNFVITEYIPTDERTGPRFPLLLTTGRILSQYNVGAQTRRTANSVWHAEDMLEIHPHDAEERGIRDGDWVRLASRAGATSLRAHITERVAPGVVYTTFHHPDTQANVVTTDYADWATSCPEYKVTAVQVVAGEWADRVAAQLSRVVGTEPAGRARTGKMNRAAATPRPEQMPPPVEGLGMHPPARSARIAWHDGAIGHGRARSRKKCRSRSPTTGRRLR